MSNDILTIADRLNDLADQLPKSSIRACSIKLRKLAQQLQECTATTMQRDAQANIEQRLFASYGLLLGTAELAEVLHYSGPHSVLSSINKNTFPIPTTRIGKRRVASYIDVANYLKGATN